MSNAIDTFFSAWGMSDANQRRDAIAKAIADDAQYADPRSDGALTGLDAITGYVSMFSENAPGWQATVIKSDETAGSIRSTVAFGGKGPDGSDMVQHGQYFAECADGKITKMVGFVGTGEPA
jgi:hypothetical protein